MESNPPVAESPADEPIRLDAVLLAELEHIRGGEASVNSNGQTSDTTEKPSKQVVTTLHSAKLTALCLSGGGIRSATFNLGILQALAKANLLQKFDYLSTVSGGGYIGSWLSAWIYNKNDSKAVFEALARSATSPPDDPELLPIVHLREYSSYLSPRLGLLSADTWTLVTTFIRNLLLNWLVLVPVIALVLMIPRFGIWEVTWTLGNAILPGEVWGIRLMIPAALCQVWGLAYMTATRSRISKQRDTQGHFLIKCLFPMLVAASLTATAWVSFSPHVSKLDVADLYRQISRDPSSAYRQLNDLNAAARTWQQSVGLRYAMIGYQIVLAVAGWFGARVLLSRQGEPPSAYQCRRLLYEELPAVVIAAGVGGLFTWIFATQPCMNPTVDPRAYVTLAVPLYLAAFLLSAVVLSGLSSFFMTDDDREWTARSAAWMFIATFAWLGLSFITLYGPSLFLWLGTHGKAAFASGGALSGLATALLARSAKTPATNDQREKLGGFLPLQWLLLAAALVFIVCMLTFVSLGTDWLLVHPRRGLPPVTTTYRQVFSPILSNVFWQIEPPLPPTDWHMRMLVDAGLWHLMFWAFILLVIGVAASSCVNVNKFSLYATYRNRLVRAYLAASRATRPGASPFTGFDSGDNIPLSKLKTPNPAGQSDRRKPLHLLNMTLNLVEGSNLAWQQRKAESFTATALHCGNASLGYRPSEKYGGGWWGRWLWLFRDGENEITRLTLGAAMAVSGAAANPNMGANSSPLITFLMTLFNVRLGVWVGNPGTAGGASAGKGCSWGRPSPAFAMKPLFGEALGLTDDTNRYVNLSDGGHFDNLGVYEMVRRRCRCIVVSDAGEDPSCSFEDLANTIRKVYIDMGIEIRFDGEVPIYPRVPKCERPHSYCAIANIGYSAVDDPQDTNPEITDGKLIYLKPTLYGDEPTDIYNYAQASLTFPHETTANQFFTESQFESYRKLGHYIGTELFSQANATDPDTCDAILRGPQDYLKKRFL